MIFYKNIFSFSIYSDKLFIFVGNMDVMAADYTCITRKIEINLHRHGDSEEAIQRYRDELQLWDAINANLYKAANRIVSHSFFNDAYEYRIKLQSPRYQKIEDKLNKAKKLNLTSEEIKQLKAERKSLLIEFSKQKLAFLQGNSGKGSVQNSTYKVVSNEFLDIIPSDVLTNLNQNISSTYNNYKLEVERGLRTIPHFRKDIPVPFSIKKNKDLKLKKRDDGSIYVIFPKGLEWDLYFGRDRSNNREIVERVLNKEYDVGNSSIQEGKNKKKFLLLVVKIPKETKKLNEEIVVGVDLGINTPLCAALNDNKYGGLSIGSRDQFLKVRMRMNAQKRELQRNLRNTTHGGHGRKQKLQALERLEGKERRWVHLQNHIFSKTIIEYALQHKAGVIQMERLTGFGRNIDDEVDNGYKFILRYWSFFELQTMIEYKAKAVGIEVRYVNPYHTSQTCSFCGYFEKGQRINQATFVCKNPNCKEGKGQQNTDGTYKGINADWNAARNIALSKDFLDKKKK